MPIEARCPQCLFVSRQLGQPTPCLLHVSLAADAEPDQPAQPVAPDTVADYDEPYAFGLRPTVDQPGPFTLRQYVRLQLLRSRIQANPSRLDHAAPRAQGRSLSRR